MDPTSETQSPKNREGHIEKSWQYWATGAAVPVLVGLLGLSGAVYSKTSNDKSTLPTAGPTPTPTASATATPTPAGMTPATAPTKPPAADPYTGGWGPERRLFSIRNPASYAVLDSITDNPAYGDERDFTQIKHLEQSNSTYSDMIRAEPGDILEVTTYVANNCADNLAGPPATIHGLTAQLVGDPRGTDLPIEVLLGADNAAQVYDGVTVVTKTPSRLVAVGGSAIMHTGDNPEMHLDDAGFIKGEPMALGQFKQDGEYPVGRDPHGGERGTGYLTFRLRVEALPT
jgi:hypothetical protein